MPVAPDDLALIAEKLTIDFEFYKNKKIFLTGGTGFFGKWLLESFIYLNENCKLNLSVTILSRSPEKFIENYPHLSQHDNFTFVQGDVRSFNDIDLCFDLIIHAATDVSAALNRTNPELMRSIILAGAKRICEFANKVNCSRILYTSSGAAYGPQPETLPRMPETFVDNPLFNDNDAYATAKLASEKYFKDNAPCEVVIARCFAFAGPYLPLDGSYAFGNFINDVLNHKDINISGDGKTVRSYLYAADLVIWLLRLLSAGKNREIYNVGSSESITIAGLAHTINAVTSGGLEVHVLGKDSQSRNLYVPDINKAKVEIDLEPYTSLETAIKRTLAFNRKND